MTTTFSEFMKSRMAAGYDWTNKPMRLVLLHHIVTVGTTTPNNVQGLLDAQGFQEVDLSVCPTYRIDQQTVGPSVTGTVTSVIYGADFQPITVAVPPATDAPVFVAAGLFYVVDTVGGVTNPWVFITDDAFGAVLNPGVRITGPPNPTTGVPIRRLFSYQVRGSAVDIVPESIVRTPGVLEWESARIQHVYVYPQRVNWVPNPSFESPGFWGWRSNGTMSLLTPGVDHAANRYIHTTGTILESIPVPTAPNFRFSAWIKSDTATKVNLALVSLNESYGAMQTTEIRQEPLHTNWTRYDRWLEPTNDASAVVPHIEANGPFDCDLVLLESGDALNAYYDGDSNSAIVGDFSWQGVEAQSYSFWYNNRGITAARLFGEYIPDGQVYAEPALVLEWVPTGCTVHTHWDVLSSFDTRHPLEDWSSHTMP